MKRRIVSMLLASLCLFVDAAVIQKVYLKNGSVLNGYIEEQDKKGNIVFCSENATICITAKDVKTEEVTYSISDLDAAWKEWADANDAYSGSDENRTLTLNNLTFSGSAETNRTPTFEGRLKQNTGVQKVKVVENGVTIRYIELSPNTYNLVWDDIVAIKSDKRPKTALTGMNRDYHLKDGRTVSGQYAGETYTTMSVYGQNGIVETFNLNELKSYTSYPINKNMDIFEQSRLLDIITLKDGSVTDKGIIVERNYETNNRTLVIQLADGKKQTINLSDVDSYRKEVNEKYVEKNDIFLKNMDVMINRIRAVSVGVTKKESILVLDSLPRNVKIAKTGESTKVTLEYYNPNDFSDETFILVRVNKYEISKKKSELGFSTDLYDMKKISPTKKETTVNHTTRIEYTVNNGGLFAFYNTETKKAFPFFIATLPLK